MIETVVRVGIAEMDIVRAPDKIRTLGLGSCVGVVIYDSHKKLAGMVHIMLPDSSLARGKQLLNKAKFADTGLQELVDSLIKRGASPHQLKAKIAGGAQMFQFSSQSDGMRIGHRNVEAVKTMLQRLRIELIAEDTGGNRGRTIEFDPETSLLDIRSTYEDTITI
ncbi:chemotaxis protein CheD [Bacillus sp. FJAT-50079]|uniref:chemotaxis protein CheD n=1 Tax=Bacillus sp. FJAT-50079 TaxID=2833577 RepID=UPI001BC8EEAA|nr:chemotaxis protein CheD [Bacillus sp. FJAT-50079]MBS4207600.1 chemotaxis protein CheD [Bacillus sp. FJAT-50079]